MEIDRVLNGPNAMEGPTGDLVGFTVDCDSDPNATIGRAKLVMRTFLLNADRLSDTSEEWQSVFPEWFASSFAPERTLQETERLLEAFRRKTVAERRNDPIGNEWSRASWLFSMKAGEREWEWWDLIPLNDRQFKLVAVCQDWPIGWDQLRHMLLACGATALDAELLSASEYRMYSGKS